VQSSLPIHASLAPRQRVHPLRPFPDTEKTMGAEFLMPRQQDVSQPAQTWDDLLRRQHPPRPDLYARTLGLFLKCCQFFELAARNRLQEIFLVPLAVSLVQQRKLD